MAQTFEVGYGMRMVWRYFIIGRSLGCVGRLSLCELDSQHYYRGSCVQCCANETIAVAELSQGSPRFKLDVFISKLKVVEYVGEIVGLRVSHKREAEYHFGKRLQYQGACYLFKIDSEQIIDATCKGDIARFDYPKIISTCARKILRISNMQRGVRDTLQRFQFTSASTNFSVLVDCGLFPILCRTYGSCT